MDEDALNPSRNDQLLSVIGRYLREDGEDDEDTFDGDAAPRPGYTPFVPPSTVAPPPAAATWDFNPSSSGFVGLGQGFLPSGGSANPSQIERAVLMLEVDISEAVLPRAPTQLDLRAVMAGGSGTVCTVAMLRRYVAELALEAAAAGGAEGAERLAALVGPGRATCEAVARALVVGPLDGLGDRSSSALHDHEALYEHGALESGVRAASGVVTYVVSVVTHADVAADGEARRFERFAQGSRLVNHDLGGAPDVSRCALVSPCRCPFVSAPRAALPPSTQSDKALPRARVDVFSPCGALCRASGPRRPSTGHSRSSPSDWAAAATATAWPSATSWHFAWLSARRGSSSWNARSRRKRPRRPWPWWWWARTKVLARRSRSCRWATLRAASLTSTAPGSSWSSSTTTLCSCPTTGTWLGPRSWGPRGWRSGSGGSASTAATSWPSPTRRWGAGAWPPARDGGREIVL